MAKETNTSVQIYLEFNPNMASAKKSKESIDNLKKSLEEMQQAGEGNTEAAAKLEKQIVSEQKAFEKYNERVERTKEILNDLSGATYNELLGQKKALQKQLNSLKKGSEEYNATQEQLIRVNREMNDESRKTKDVQEDSSRAMDLVNAKSVALIGVLTGLAMGVINVAKEYLSFDKIINSNQVTGDQYAATMAGVKASMEAVQRSIALMDFSNLIQDMKEAYQSAKDYTMAMDELFEMNNSYKLQTAGQAKELEELRIISADVRKSDEERVAASKKYLEITEKQRDQQKDILTTEAAANEKRIKDQTKMSDAELQFMVDNYNTNRNILTKSLEYVELENKVRMNQQTLKSDANNQYARAFMKNAQEQLKTLEDQNEGIKKFADLRRKYEEKTNDEVVSLYVESKAKLQNADAQYLAENRRVINQHNSLEESLRKKNEDASKKALEDKKKRDKASVDSQVEAINDKLKEEIHALNMVQMNEEIRAKMKEELEYKALLDTINIVGLEEKEKKAAMDRIYAYQEKMAKQSKSMQVDMLVDGIAHVNALLSKEMAKMSTNLKQTTDAQNQYQIDAFNAKERLLGKNAKAQYESKQKEINKLHAEGVMTDKEYHTAMKQNNLDYNISRVQQAQVMISALADLTNSMQEAELNSLENKRQKELAAAGDDAEKKAEIERKYEADKLEVQKKYADVQFGIKVAEIIANTAVAIMTAMAQLGPVAGGIAAGMLGATGLVQIAIANQERERVKSMTIEGGSAPSPGAMKRIVKQDGFKDGGFTPNVGEDVEVGPAHGGEYYIPAWMLKQVPVMNSVKALEAVRTGKMSASELASSQGSPATQTIVVQNSPSDYRNIVMQEKLIDLLDDLRENGIDADVSLSKIEQKQRLDERRKFTRKKKAS